MLPSFYARFSLLCLLFCLLLSSQSCASSILSKRGSYLHDYHDGMIPQAEQKLSHLVEKNMPQGRYTQSKEATWMLLDRATTRFAMGYIEGALEDYSTAIEALDYYRQDVTAEKVAQVLFQDEAGAYQASDFEQILARVYFALALLHAGDEGNAYAMLRQAEGYIEEQRFAYSKIPFMRHYRLSENALSKYLFALLLQRKGDTSNSQLLYQQASRLTPFPYAEDLTAYNPSKATVLVICHNGNAPYKISSMSSASAASALALEVFLGAAHNRPAISTLSGIPVPVLQRWPFSDPTPTYAALDGIQKPLLPFYNVYKNAQEELEQKTPIIIARGVARLAVRRSAVGYLQRQDEMLGALADLAMCIFNDTTRADTRSWTTLPSFIDLTRFEVEPGCHSLAIQTYDTANRAHIENYQLNLKPRDLCIVHVFNIHPGISRILIPNRYLMP